MSHGTLQRAQQEVGADSWYGHHKANSAALHDGEWVLVDCAPD